MGACLSCSKLLPLVQLLQIGFSAVDILQQDQAGRHGQGLRSGSRLQLPYIPLPART